MKPSDYKISLDILESQSQYSLPMKKGDTARVVDITLREGVVPYEIGEDCFAVLSGRKPDGSVLENNCVIKGNTIIYEITPQTTSASGLVDCEIKLYGVDNGLICSARFSIIVDKRVVGDEEVESTSEFTALTEMYNTAASTIKAAEDATSNAKEASKKANDIADTLQTKLDNDEFKGEKGDTPETDQKFNPTSENAQSGVAVAEALKEKFSVNGTGKNLFNPNDPDIVVGKIFDADGNLSVANASFLTSGYIPVEEGKHYYATVLRNGVRNIVVRTHAFYDENKALVSASNTVLTSVLAIPTEQNIKYVRVSTYSTSGGGSEWQFEKDLQTDYEPYHLIYALSEDVVGSSLKTSVENNEAFIKTSSSLNLINPNDLIVGKRYKDSDGTLETASGFSSTKPIDINGFDKIVIQQNIQTEHLRAVLFYDSDVNIIEHYSTVLANYPSTVWYSSLDNGGSVCIILIPENACYCALSVLSDRVNTLMVYGVKGENVIPLPTPYQEYVEAYRPKQSILPVERYIKSYFNGKKLVAIGDSITYGTGLRSTEISWSQQVASMFNMTFVNYGIGGSEIAINKANSPYNPMCVRYAEMDDDADLIIVAGGTNDWGHITGLASVGDGEYLMGEFGDTEPTTFYGALDTMCKGLLAKYVGKTIFFMTPIKRYSGLNTPYYNENYRGYTLEDYANAIKKVCSFYGIPVLDMFNECSLNAIIEAIRTAYITDGTHPNFAGHRIMARQVAGFVSRLANDIDYS